MLDVRLLLLRCEVVLMGGEGGGGGKHAARRAPSASHPAEAVKDAYERRRLPLALLSAASCMQCGGNSGILVGCAFGVITDGCAPSRALAAAL